MNLFKERSAHSSRGSTFVEFALVFPVILGMMLAGFELVRGIQLTQTLSSISREAANAAHRRCASSDVADVSACLTTVYSELKTFTDSAASGAEVVISIFERDTIDPSIVSRTALAGVSGSIETPGATPVGNFVSRVDVATFDPVLKSTPPLALAINRFTVAEVFYEHIPVAEALTSKFGLTRRVHYEVCIF